MQNIIDAQLFMSFSGTWLMIKTDKIFLFKSLQANKTSKKTLEFELKTVTK